MTVNIFDDRVDAIGYLTEVLKGTDMCDKAIYSIGAADYCTSDSNKSAEARREELRIQLSNIEEAAEAEKTERKERERQGIIRELVGATMAYDKRAQEILKEAEELKKVYDNVRANAAFNRGKLFELGVRIDPHDPT